VILFAMPPFQYRCPSTGCLVEGFVAEELPKDADDALEAMRCAMCQQVHLVNSATGEMLGDDE
jgi:hypothetical protein